MSIEARKHTHISVAIENSVSFETISAGFEDVLVYHDSIPDLNLSDIKTDLKFLKKDISAPIMIDSITGGFTGAEKINKKLAGAAEKENIPFSLGSQRAMIEKPALSYTYKVRDVAPSIPIVGNIGIANLSNELIGKLESALKEIDADALAIHLNPIQEAIQKEGDTYFKHKFDLIDEVCEKIDVPVIIKEVGHGMSIETLKKLEKTKAQFINIAGAGGTSWAKIERLRNNSLSSAFDEDGIPTVVSLVFAKKYTSKKLIASGGVRNGIEIAKSICLGAELGAAAIPFLRAYYSNSVTSLIRQWKSELKNFMFTRNINDIKSLRKLKPKLVGNTKELVDAHIRL
ncbi:MAG: type 2 isopentenyl-diphosphate Delta-isomerase [Candidatus Micrarchaeota archaeon]|nr:type 2 isopentenyl-diphosphate Delta-isomerase [Candidatus Micrarchaeota archaeon]